MLERLLQIHLAVLATIGTFFLGIAQGNLVLPFVTLLAATVAVVLTDILKWFQLPRPLANLAAVAAVIISLSDLSRSEQQNQLIAIANLLTYLQIVLLFQEKHVRLNWQLITLSLLQVVVSAALNLGLAFGLLMLVYMAIMFSALTLFFVIRETDRYRNRDHRADEANIATAKTGTKSRAVPSWKQALGSNPTTNFGLSRQATLVEFFRGGLVGQIVVAMLMSLVFSGITFFIEPRVRGTNWNAGRTGRVRTVGFSPNISLKEMGEVLQDQAVAMRVSFYDAEGKPYLVKHEPYLCGAILTRYGHSDTPGRWTTAGAYSPSHKPDIPESHKVVREVIHLEPTSETNLFSVFPAHCLAGWNSKVVLNAEVGSLHRVLDTQQQQYIGPFRYSVGTTGLRDGLQPPVVPIYCKSDEGSRTAISRDYREILLFISPDRFPQLVQTAKNVLEEAKALDAPPQRKAKLLEAHFRQSKLYSYTLKFNRRRDRSLDPIEDFVANQRAGHCEYFASALTLMLRSQGIPARLIVGYHGGEYNPVGNYWLVRQKDAHAWVEALLDPEDVTDIPADPNHPVQGAWLRLDPTPESSLDDADNYAATQWGLYNVFGYAQFLWNDYVLGLNSERQQTNVTEPLTNTISEVFEQLSKMADWQNRTPENGDKSAPLRFEDRFSCARAVLAMIVSGCLYAAFNRLVAFLGRHARARQLLARLRGLFAPILETSDRHVEFYHRFEAFLARRGLRRTSQQTPQEFAAAVGVSPDYHAHPEVLAAAERIVGAFYRIRFGHQPISEEQAQAVEADLNTIERAANPERWFSAEE